MTRRLSAFLLSALLLCPVAGYAAIRPADNCNLVREEIFKLLTPEYPSNAIWNAIYGETNAQERFIGGIVMESEHVLAIGERFRDESGNAELAVAEIDPYGRVAAEHTETVKGLRGLGKLVERKDGFVVLGSARTGKDGAQPWLGFFNPAGKMLRTKIIAGGMAQAQDLVPLQDNTGYMMAAAAPERGGISHTEIYKLSNDGKVILHRSFAPGIDNTIVSLSPAGKDLYMGAGYIRGDDGRKTGWLVMFNKDAEIVWQRQYPRGREAILNRTIGYQGDYMIVLGESAPSGGGNRAGWVMMTNTNNGDIMWQRYYTGYLDYSARDVMISKKGLISVLLDSQVPEIKDDSGDVQDKMPQPSIRLLTLNARGTVLRSEEYTNGEGTHGYRLLEGPNENRIVIGSTDMTYIAKKPDPSPAPAKSDEKDGPVISPVKSMEKPEAKPAPAPAPAAPAMTRSMDGWMIAALPVLPYKDPCLAK